MVVCLGHPYVLIRESTYVIIIMIEYIIVYNRQCTVPSSTKFNEISVCTSAKLDFAQSRLKVMRS